MVALIFRCSHSRRCATWFHISSEARIEEVVDDEGDNTQSGVAGPSGQRDRTRKYSAMDEESQRLFRRWHIIWEDREVERRSVERCLDSLTILSSILS